MTTKLSTLLIRPNFTVTAAIQSISLCEHIISEIGAIPNLASLKLDPDFICYIASKVENQMNKKDPNKRETNTKLEVFWQIYIKLFSEISQADRVTIEAMLNFMIQNKHVQKVSLSRVAAYYLKKKLNL